MQPEPEAAADDGFECDMVSSIRPKSSRRVVCIPADRYEAMTRLLTHATRFAFEDPNGLRGDPIVAIERHPQPEGGYLWAVTHGRRIASMHDDLDAAWCEAVAEVAAVEARRAAARQQWQRGTNDNRDV